MMMMMMMIYIGLVPFDAPKTTTYFAPTNNIILENSQPLRQLLGDVSFQVCARVSAYPFVLELFTPNIKPITFSMNWYNKYSNVYWMCKYAITVSMQIKLSRANNPLNSYQATSLMVSISSFNTEITVCTVVQNCCKGRSKKYRKWHFSGCCRRETP